MRKPVVIAALALATAGIGWFAFRRTSAPTEAAPVTGRVARRALASTVSATGAVKPQVGAEVRVGSRLSGRVERLRANLKDTVQKGQIIAELEARDLEAAIAERRGEVRLAEARLASVDSLLPKEAERARAEVDRWEASAALAAKELAREEDLLRQEFTAVQSRDQANERVLVARAQAESARRGLELLRVRQGAEAEQARAEIDRARAALTGAEIQFSYAVLRAPISGVIGSVSTQEGETVAAGLNAPTFVTIIDLSRLQVDAFVDEVDIGKVRVGQNVRFTVDAFPAFDFEGRVVAIYPKAFLQDNVVKYVVAVEVSTPYEGKLRPEMTASVTILLEARTALAIPSRAVRREGGRTVVRVVVDGKSETREVRLGWKEGPWVEVASGLAEGDEIVVEEPVQADR